MAVLVRLRLHDDYHEPYVSEWRKLLRGVLNNNPEVAREWKIGRPIETKRLFREKFGQGEGDRLRLSGAGFFRLGPHTEEVIKRFSIKLGQALYYRHTGEILNGKLFFRIIDPMNEHIDIGEILEIMPLIEISIRSKKDLSGQFSCRYNVNRDEGLHMALVRFSEQILVQTIAMPHDVADRVMHGIRAEGLPFPEGALIEVLPPYL